MTTYIIATKRDKTPVPLDFIANIPGVDITATMTSMRNLVLVESDYTLEEMRERLGDSFHIEIPQEYKVL